MENRTAPSLLRSVAVSFAVTAVTVTAILTLLPLLLLASPDPAKLVTPAAYGTLAFGAILCGVLSARLHRTRGLLCGAVAGGVYGLTLLSAGCAVYGLQKPLASLGICLLAVALAAAAGRVGLPREKRRRFPGRR